MNRLTVASAALAAGMLTFGVHAQAESNRYRGEDPASATDKRAVPAKAAAKSSERAVKKEASAQPKPKRSKARRSKIAPQDIDAQTTASIVSQLRPELVAKARKKVIGLDEATAQSGDPVAETSYTTLVSQYATTYGVPVSLAHAVIRVESNYRPDMRGRAGEIGLMQIKPATARMMGYSGSEKGLFAPETNIKYGMKYLGMARELAGGSTCGTILRYNAGHGARRMNPTSAAYCSKVQKLM